MKFTKKKSISPLILIIALVLVLVNTNKITVNTVSNRDAYSLYSNIMILKDKNSLHIPDTNKYKVEMSQEGVTFLKMSPSNTFVNSGKFKINYIDMMLIDGKLTMKIEEFKKIRNKFYSEIKDSYTKVLTRIEVEKGLESSYLMIYKKHYSETSFEYILLIFYIDTKESSMESYLNVIIENIHQNYSEKIIAEKQFWKGQLLNTPEEVVPLLHWSDFNSKPHFDEKLYTSLNKEGVVMNMHEDKGRMEKVKYSFRYDQLINCEGVTSLNKLQKYVGFIQDEEIKMKIPNLKCCVAYNTNWGDYVDKELFCSNLTDTNLCQAEIKIFSNSILHKCTLNGAERLLKLFNEFKLDFHKMMSNLSTLEKIKYYHIVNILNKYELPQHRTDHSLLSMKNYLDFTDLCLEKYLNCFKSALQDINIDKALRMSKLDLKGGEFIKGIDKTELKNKLEDNFLRQNLNITSDQYLKTIERLVDRDELLPLLNELVKSKLTIPYDFVKDLDNFNLGKVKKNLGLIKKDKMRFLMKDAGGNITTNSNSNNNRNVTQVDKGKDLKVGKVISIDDKEYTKGIGDKEEEKTLTVLAKKLLAKMKEEDTKNKNTQNTNNNGPKNTNNASENPQVKPKKQMKLNSNNIVKTKDGAYLYNLDDEDEKELSNFHKDLKNTNNKKADSPESSYSFNLDDEDDKQVGLLMYKTPKVSVVTPLNLKSNNIIRSANGDYLYNLDDEDEKQIREVMDKGRKKIQMQLKQKNIIHANNGEYLYSLDEDEEKIISDLVKNSPKGVKRVVTHAPSYRVAEKIEDVNVISRVSKSSPIKLNITPAVNYATPAMTPVKTPLKVVPLNRNNLMKTNSGEYLYNMDDEDEKELQEIFTKAKPGDSSKSNNKSYRKGAEDKHVDSKHKNEKDKKKSKEDCDHDKYQNNEDEEVENSDRENLENQDECNDNEDEDRENSENKSKEVCKENKKKVEHNKKEKECYHKNHKNNNRNVIKRRNNNHTQHNSNKNKNSNCSSNSNSNSNSNKNSRNNNQNNQNNNKNYYNNNENNSFNSDRDLYRKGRDELEAYQNTNSHNLLNRIKAYNNLIDPVPIQQVHVINPILPVAPTHLPPGVVEVAPLDPVIRRNIITENINIMDRNDINYLNYSQV